LLARSLPGTLMIFRTARWVSFDATFSRAS
jgi:hypothetical protein